MATNLLLEGDDLEALLIRAHAEGGVNARIVRAEKVRHGGMLGFFAKESFEVAVEIPEVDAPLPDTPESSAAGREAVPHRPDAPTTAGTPVPPAPPAPGRGPGPVDAPTPGQGTLTGTIPAPRRPPTASGAGPDHPAAAGLLGLADRVSAAERAAARAAATAASRSLAARTTATAQRPERIVLPGAAPADREPVGVPALAPSSSASAGRPADGARDTGAGAGAAPPGPDTTVLAPSRPAASGAGHGGGPPPGGPPPGGPPSGSGFPAGRSIPFEDVPPDAAAEERDPFDDGVPTWVIPHEEPTAQVRPSTARPEFTALLDQLRAGTQPPRQPGRYEELSGPVPAPRSRAESLYAEASGEGARPETAAAPFPEHHPTPVSSPSTAYPVPAPRPAHPARGTDPRGESDEPGAPPFPAPPPPPAARRGSGDRRQPADPGLAADRRTLRDLGVPAAWTRRLRGGDRFSAVVRMLERMPDVDLDADLPVVALVGPAGPVQLEAHRTALDLHLDDRPRPVVVVPRDRRSRGAAIARSHRLGVCVVAVETNGYDCDETVAETLQAVEADAVIALVDASSPTEECQRWLDAIGQVDAITVDNAAAAAANAAPLQLGLPVVRLDGIPIDRITWAAVLCAQLEAARPTE